MRYQDIVDRVIAEAPIKVPVWAQRESLLHILPLLDRALPKRGRLLDVGCGSMIKLAAFRWLGFQCHGVDDFGDQVFQEEGVVETLIAWARQQGLDVHVSPVGGLPLAPFDCVTFIHVIEHLHESPRGVLRSFSDILRPGGILLVVTPNAVNIRKRLDVLRGVSNYPPLAEFWVAAGTWRGHVREYTLAELKSIVQWAGFAIREAGYFDGMVNHRLRSRLARAIYRATTRFTSFLKDTLYVVAAKPES